MKEIGMKIRNAVWVLLLLCLPFALFGGGARDSSAYPSKNITILITRGAGGPTDVAIRTVLEFIKPKLPSGVVFMPVNRPEGTGIAAMVEGAHARPDGYTLTAVLKDTIIYTHMGLMKETAYDYRGIACTNQELYALVVKGDSPFNTLKEFIDYARQHPGEVTMGTVGAGSPPQLAVLDLENKLNLKFMQVPYNDGAAACNAAIIGGHLTAVFNTISTCVSQVGAGELKVLGITDAKRSEIWPNVPTFKESLNIDFNHSTWSGLGVPKDTPDSVVNYLVNLCREVMVTSAYKEQCKKIGIGTPEIFGADFDKFMREEHETMKSLVEQIK
jgi:tripartite-type tricarboxylate transporter receptor subunit TctC